MEEFKEGIMFYVKGADPSLSCDDDCLKTRLCDIVTANSGDFTQCNLKKEKFLSTAPSPSPSSSSPLASTHFTLIVGNVLCFTFTFR
ncbi:hypothetical protein PR048_007037 [Dryococelus australis]|uniref:Uncharacterized protein n=1 Tax=Dryococelus australis TaxID=614101 RepID=A0ABQ9ICL3_9NEOP|nr:hypothetical protein PR048_007037 [Dryococelus australis]